MSAITAIIIAAAVIGGVGLFVGVFLGYAGRVFAVVVDHRVEEVRESLPGANCGACGYPGCDALADAIVRGEAPVGACVVGQAPVAERIARILGRSAEKAERKVAFVRCTGSCDVTTELYAYTGTTLCRMVKFAPSGGPKSCRYGCTGFGDCVSACEFDALHIVRGIARVDEERCVDCRKCMAACPKGLIIEVPYGRTSHIGCVSPDKGKPVMEACGKGCISCQKCVRTCSAGAITMEGGIPVIDYETCSDCGACREACPRHCII